MRHSCFAVAGGLLLGLAASAPGAAQAADPPACRTVRFADIGWVDVTATTALTALILKDLGYTPKITELTVPTAYQALKAKEIDVFLGNWMPAMEAERKPFLDDKSVDVLGPNLEGAKFTLAVPQYTYDKGLHDFQDIHNFGKELGFKIYGIEPGNDGNQHVFDLIGQKRFGLEKFQLVEGSEQSMLAQVDKAVRRRQPIVFLGWQPHPMNLTFKLAYLTGGDDTFGANFGAASVYTNVRAGYAAECPNVGKLLQNEKFSLAGEDAMEESILDKKTDPAKAAAAWLHGHRPVLETWLDGVTTFDGKPGLSAFETKR
jgi:glycine betaine/proline transport system substrate-binding protein